MITDQEGLERLCREWQERLRLQDWEVRVHLVRHHVMDPGNQGECEWHLQTKRAIIKILDPQDYPPVDWEQDHELALVHELLHLHFAPIVNGQSDHAIELAEEQAIHAIAMALVRVKREAGEPAPVAPGDE